MQNQNATGDGKTSTHSVTQSVVNKLMKVLDRTIETYRKQAKKEVQEAASKVFLEVTNAPANFSGISLDENFDARIKKRDGTLATSPSSGMKSMMTISIIDGLRQVSGLEAPIFFDTPGRSLDEDHKQAMLNYFWKDKGQQFLIFAHSGEYRVEDTVADFGDRIAKRHGN